LIKISWHRIRVGLLTVLLSCPAFAQNFVTVSSSLINNGQGNSGPNLLQAGTIIFLAVNTQGQAISYQAGGGGQVISWPVVCPITNGAFSCALANGSLTNPANICFQVTVKDVNNNTVIGGTNPNSGYQCVQTATTNFWCSAGTCDFDTYFPQANGIPIVPLPPPSSLSLGGVYAESCAAGEFVLGYATTGAPICSTVNWTSGSGAPTSTPAVGSLYTNIAGTFGSTNTLYVYTSSGWKGVI
jgi:hypothetical protein